jgi:exodeoxyribonuclease V alpha subunit
MIRGIGPVYAKKMVKAFGEKVFDVIEAEPDRSASILYSSRDRRIFGVPGESNGAPCPRW